MVMVYQFSMGLLIFKTYRDIQWRPIVNMMPSMFIGVVIGIVFLNTLNGDIMRGLLAGYIILHLLRKYSSFDPMGRLIKWGDAHFAGFIGGILNALMGGGGPAFILYLRDHIHESALFRASIIATLMVSNIPRSIGTLGTGLMSFDLFMTSLYAYPAFLIALYLGQTLHGKIPQERFFKAVEVLLGVSAVLLIGKIVL